MKAKRFICIVAVLAMIIGLTSCNLGPSTEPNDSETTGTTGTTAASLSPTEWEDTNPTDDFDNSDEVGGPTDPGNPDYSNHFPTPTNNYVNDNKPGGKDTQTTGSNPDTPPEPKEPLPDSLLDDRENLQFIYEGESYAYGVTADGQEVISFRESDGDLLDILGGGGQYVVNSVGTQTTGTRALLTRGDIKSCEQTFINNNIAVVITYYGSGDNATNAELQTTYVFMPGGIHVEARLAYAHDNLTISGSKTRLTRSFLYGSESVYKTFNTDWVYPADGDYPYKETESWITITTIDSRHKLYTFLRSSDIPSEYTDLNTRFPTYELPCYFEDGRSIDYILSYDLVMDTVEDGDGSNSDYLALFKSRNAGVAVAITPLKPTDDNSTVFVGKEVEFNINITNIVPKEDTTFSLRYDVMDYYGNVVDAGIYIDSTVFKGMQANRRIKISTDKTGKVGMYFINLVVITRTFSYQEYYPFAIIPEHDYQYMSTSPFGINQIQGGPNNPYMDFINLAKKVGVAITRGSANVSLGNKADSIKILERAKELGIRYVINARDEATVEAFKDYSDDIIVGNEPNMAYANGTLSLTAAFDSYKASLFDFGYSSVKMKYGKNHVIAGVAGCQFAWFQTIKDRGLWDRFDIISAHPYGFPYAPDTSVSGGNIRSLLWHAEGGFMRAREASDTFGYKPIYVNEMGYPTPPGNKTYVDLRTQADYNMRCYILGLAYNMQALMAYCFTDYQGGHLGTNLTEVEFHFGAFYWPDYYGRILPKPVSIAFSALTRLMESVTSASFNSVYNSGTLRAFNIQTKEHGNIIALWSNCSKLPNDAFAQSARSPRNPTPPWKNQWLKSENVTLNARGAKVTVVDVMGNSKEYTASGGKVTIPVSGSPIYVLGAY